MKSKNILTGILLLSIVFFISCKKYLDKQSDSSYVVPGTLDDLQGLLDDGNIMNDYTTPSYGEASCDDYFLQPDLYNSLREELTDTYTWVPHNYYANNDWSYGYLPVYNSNYCLETLPGIPVTEQNEAKWNNVKGSALFFRAYYFLLLAWDYAKAYDESTANADLGVVLRLGSDFNIKSVRSNVKETYDRILADAKESIQYLPNLPVHPFRPSKAAAYGLLARTYLSMRQYDSTFKYADSCLQIKNSLLDYNDASINAGSSVPFQPFNAEIIFYTVMNLANQTPAPGVGTIDSTLYNSYDTNDLRRPVFFTPNGSYYSFKGSYAANAVKLFTGEATDEMYFIRAECYARKNNLTNALADLNTVMRKRWANSVPYVGITASSGAEALSKILVERRKELLDRGLRWMDIKRLNKEGDNITLTRNINGKIITLPPNDNKYALPLPTDIINEAEIEQNPE